VRLTRDGRVVLLHDEGTHRVAACNLAAAGHSLESLRRADVGAWKGPLYAGERIPTLDEALEIIPDGRRLLIEIKCGAEILPALEIVFAGSARPESALVLMSFDFEVAAGAKRRFPQVETHWIVEHEATAPAALADRARAAGLDGLNLDRRFPIDGTFVAAVHAAGLKLHVWTVDDAAEARSLAVVGVDSITTNRPGWLRDRLAGG
jgi:glycerophosphoryl diester phosphodiesterase